MAKESAETAKGGDVNAAKLKALQATLDKIEKDFGKGTIMKLGDQPKWDVSVIPSGSIALDCALGIGGYPKGRVIEIYGPESSGKTTLAIHAKSFTPGVMRKRIRFYLNVNVQPSFRGTRDLVK